MENQIKIYLVDDSDSFRKSLKLYIEDVLKYKVVGESTNGKDFLETILNHVDIVLMDIEMPEMNGIDATKRMLWEYPDTKFIAVSYYKDKLYLEKLIKAGFKGCVFKQDVYSSLDLAIKKVLNGKLFFPEDLKLHKS